MPDATYPQPRWRVVMDGVDVSSRIAPRLMSLTITADRAQDADQLDLTVSDHDGQLELPRRGGTAQVSLGWDTAGLTDMGTFVIDEVEHAGAPDTITVRGRSAHLAAPIRQKREQSWDDKLLGDIVNEVAGRNGLAAAVSAKLKSIVIGHVDQTRENDLNLMTRLGRMFDSVATIKHGKLIFAPIGSGATATGKKLGTVTIIRADGDQHRYHAADREAYGGVKANWRDVHAADDKAVVAGDETNAKTLRTVYATQDDAQHAATAEWNRVQRGKATFEDTLARGRPDIHPEMHAKVSGFKPDINATEWLVKRVEHQLGDSGFTTRIECETAGGD